MHQLTAPELGSSQLCLQNEGPRLRKRRQGCRAKAVRCVTPWSRFSPYACPRTCSTCPL